MYVSDQSDICIYAGVHTYMYGLSNHIMINACNLCACHERGCTNRLSKWNQSVNLYSYKYLWNIGLNMV